MQSRQPAWGWGEKDTEVYLFVWLVFNLNNLYNFPSLQIVSDSLFIRALPIIQPEIQAVLQLLQLGLIFKMGTGRGAGSVSPLCLHFLCCWRPLASL